LQYTALTKSDFGFKKWTTTQNKHKQVLSSSRDGRSFGHNRHGPKSRGFLCPVFEGTREGRKPKQLQGTSTGMARHSLPNNYFRGQEMSTVVCNRGGKTDDDAKWLKETFIGSSKVT